MQQDVFWILKHRGAKGTFRWLRRSLPYYLWLYGTFAGRRERNWDRLHGVETEGLVPTWEMEDSPNRSHAVQYLPTKPKKFHRLLRSLHLDCQAFTFVDIGSGKGRVLLMALEYPFRRVMGVEFSSRLCEIARRNLGGRAEILCQDATQFVFPDEPLVIYLCNPFHEIPMRQLVANLERSVAANPRPVYVIYWNAIHPEPWSGFNKLAGRKEEYAIYRA